MRTRTGSRLRRAFRLRDGVQAVRTRVGETVLVVWPHSERLGTLTEGQSAVLRGLGSDRTVDDLAALCPAGEAHELLARLAAGGWVITTLTCEGRALFSSWPTWPGRPRAVAAGPTGRRLSRLAWVRREGEDHVVESAVASRLVRLHDERLFGALVRTGAPDAVPSGVPAEAAAALWDELAGSGLLESDAESEELRLAQWSHHELAFHHGSRLRSEHTTGVDFGGTYWARGRFPPPPGRHPVWTGTPIPLPSPDLERLRVQDPPLSAVVEDRRSVRAHDDDRPIGLPELGEFLYRTARVRRTAEDGGLQVSSRPTPAGGGCHEIELYAVVRVVDGVPAGMYHYDPYDHVLRAVPSSPAAVRALMAASAAGMGPGGAPQVLLVLATRFGRLAWKYRSMAYALTLKHVGVLYQAMYLAATAMGLAPCALGVGDPDVFAAATGLDGCEETSVGEFALGSLAVPERGKGAADEAETA
ncbi:SagB/ThcOx family dehydrogenase [Nocardiopsis xinjiangensis]|uniref:SagB/ThcOx family dehydrogenase n=1 Tax=Nocardiopsis xinjiangensis TaxID=124285 RepID=UPI000349F1A6|nr:SagB family peptide dehydrogenase [Nocardiopsis xinjiangensis]